MQKVTTEEMLKALNRSGYLLESVITRYLANLGFFVESNQIIKDPITGKSREIDLVAELYNYNEEFAEKKIAAGIKYVFEIKNNLFPIVLLTKLESSPNIEVWQSSKEIVTKPNNVTYFGSEGFFDLILQGKYDEMYTQYCSFSKKKENDNLMALHPDNLYEGLLKIVQYCEEQIEIWCKTEDEMSDSSKDYFSDYFRHFLYQPIILLNDDLYELDFDKTGNQTLMKVDKSRLLFNYYYKGEPQMCMIYFVTKDGLPEFIESMMKIEKEVLNKMDKIKGCA